MHKAFYNSITRPLTPFKGNNKNILFVLAYHINVDNKILVKNLRNKGNNIKSDYLK